MPMILGGAALVLVLILVLVNSGGGGSDDDNNNNDSGGNTPAQQPAQRTPSPSVTVGSDTSGKTPDRAAPPLSQDMLSKMTSMYAEAKALSDEGIKLQKSGEKIAGSAKQSAAKVKVDAIKDMIEEQSLWYEEADMGGWAIPGEYTAMNKIYAKISRLEKTIRMNGGK